MGSYGTFFPMFKSVPTERVARASQRSLEGTQTWGVCTGCSDGDWCSPSQRPPRKGRPAVLGASPYRVKARSDSGRQSKLAPDSLTTLPHFRVSAFMKAANCSGVSL